MPTLRYYLPSEPDPAGLSGERDCSSSTCWWVGTVEETKGPRFPFTVQFDGKPTPARLNGPEEVPGLYLDLPPGEYFVGLGCGMDVIEQLLSIPEQYRASLEDSRDWMAAEGECLCGDESQTEDGEPYTCDLCRILLVADRLLAAADDDLFKSAARDREDAEKWRTLQAVASSKAAALPHGPCCAEVRRSAYCELAGLVGEPKP